MKTIPAALLAAQQVPEGRPIARASLRDNGRLHPRRLFTDAYTGGAVFGANCGGFFARLRYTASGLNTLERQVVADPAVEAEWESWAAFESNVAGVRGAAVFWTGTYVVALWQDATDRHLYYRRSTDGAAWSAKTAAYTSLAPHAASLWGVGGGAAQSGALLHFNGGLYWCAYNPAADSWAALESSGLSFDPAFSLEVAGAWDAAHSRHLIVLNPAGYFAWARFALVTLARTGPGSYTAPRPYHHAQRFNFQGLSLSAAPLNGLWWLGFHRARGWGQDVYWLAASDDGLFYADPVPTDLPAEPRLGLLGALDGQAEHYLATERHVYRSTAYTYWTDAAVVRYSLETGLARHAQPSTLTLLLDNRSGALSAHPPEMHSTLSLERGLRVAGVDYWVAAGTFHVTGFQYLAGGRLLELTAVDALGLPPAWAADQALSFKNERLDTLVEACAALAGIHAVSFDSHPLWAATLPTFTLLGGMRGDAALRSLARRAPFELRANADGALHAFIPALGPSSAYTYGGGDHAHWPGGFGARDGLNFIAVIGHPPHAQAADAFDAEAIAAAGRRGARVRADPRLGSAAEAETLAEALLLAERERGRAGVFDAPPNFALEPGDVIGFGGSGYAAQAGPWRVERIAERFNVERRRFYQRVVLRGTG
jgi:hypothetical protein